MKIKELHLRNIASIQKADIDFENGLNDSVTGQPASMFLISGDTGSGKSVILDGISMALYKMTPRTDAVINPKNNNFRNDNGEPVSINSLEQYTRIGISPKDECYSEVVFEGNDGKVYRAKLSLGLKEITRGERKGEIEYKSPKWELKIGEGDWISGKTEVKETIEKAIGLSFVQFSRMAMLAQGQFAAFLTGDKTDREQILEKLTNTEHFTKYGEAINRVFGNVKDEKRLTDERVKEMQKQALDPTTIQAYTEQKNAHEAEVKVVAEQIAGLTTQIALLETIETQSVELAKHQASLKSLTDVQESEEYKAQRALVADWDATTEQRQILRTIDGSRETKSKAETSLSKKHSEFIALTADLLHRRQKADELQAKIDDTQTWINRQASQVSIHENANMICMQINEYDICSKNLKSKREEETRIAEASRGLENNREEAQEAVQKAQDDVTKAQAEIDALIEQRQQLRPDETDSALQQANERKNELQKLIGVETKHQETLATVKHHEETVCQDEKKASELGDKIKGLTEKRNQAKQHNDEAQKRYNALILSTDEAYDKIRARLVDEKVDTCPLCGQHIELDQLQCDFAGILAPLKVEKEQTEMVYEEAENVLNAAQSELSTLNGGLNAAKTALRRAQEQSRKEAAEITGILKANDWITIDGDQAFADVKELVESVNQEITALQDDQKKAQDLQKVIDEKLRNKQALDRIKAGADKSLEKAVKDMQDNEKELAKIRQDITNVSDNRDELFGKIDHAIVLIYPDWHTTCAETMKEIGDSAKTYKDKCQFLEETKSDLQTLQELIKNLSGIHGGLLTNRPDWECSPEPKEYKCSNISEAYAKLLTDVTTYSATVANCDSEIVALTAKLAEYYQASGKSEDDLRRIQAQEKSLNGARKALEDMKTALNSNKTATEIATKAIADANEKLGVNDDNPAPVKQDLVAQKVELEAKRDSINTDIGKITEQLKANADCNSRLQELIAKQQAATKAYETWSLIKKYFGGTHFRTLVQTHILRPLLNNANIYLRQISDQFTLTCSEENEQLSIFVQDHFNRNEIRSVTLLSGGERFMVSLALSLALSSLNRNDMNVNILFIDEGFGTLDERCLESVVATLEKLQTIAGQSNRRVGIISHRNELYERIPVQIQVRRQGEGRSTVVVKNDIS
ncbi:MAG: SMC family ATPase [Muribaculaceae bacterium]|nr:SMC family ATPase [Muribaculaceae bacterium]